MALPEQFCVVWVVRLPKKEVQLSEAVQVCKMMLPCFVLNRRNAVGRPLSPFLSWTC